MVKKEGNGRDEKRSNEGKKTQVLYGIFEADPFVKTGGLGDVGGSLPAAIGKLDVDMRVILPKFGSIAESYRKKMKKVAECIVPLGWRNQYCGIEMLKHKGVIYYFVDNEYYFKRDYPYGYGDDGERIAFFSKAILECLQHIPDFFPDIIHCNDWHTALTPVFLREHYNDLEEYRRIKTVFSIHNLKFQGIYPKHILGDVLALDYCKNAVDQLSYWDTVNYMQGALYYSDRLTTVSPTYAEEICDPWYGEHMDGVFRQRRDVLSGILNGIDTYKHSPGRDPHLVQKYNASTVKEGKAANKAALQQELGLAVRDDTPLIAVISRLTEQKGLDLITHILEELLCQDVQLVVLGVGEKKYEEAFRHYQEIMPDKVSACITFDLPLSARIYAGADLLLMPSQFEPCGLSQMIAMRYGTIPVVRETGGLKDTVIDFHRDDKNGNGFSFVNYNAHELLFAIKDAVHMYHNDIISWMAIRKNAMKRDFSWKKPAQEYIRLYERLIEETV